MIVVAAVSTLPIIFVGPPGGVLSDRFQVREAIPARGAERPVIRAAPHIAGSSPCPQRLALQ